VIDGDRSGNDSVDPTCEKVKDQDVDEAHGNNDGVYSKCGELHAEKERFVILRDKEVGGMVTTDEDLVLRGD